MVAHISKHEKAKLTYLCQMYFPILINWTSPFPILGLLPGGSLIRSYIRRLEPFFKVQNFEFQYFGGFQNNEKKNLDFVDYFWGHHKI